MYAPKKHLFLYTNPKPALLASVKKKCRDEGVCVILVTNRALLLKLSKHLKSSRVVWLRQTYG